MKEVICTKVRRLETWSGATDGIKRVNLASNCLVLERKDGSLGQGVDSRAQQK